ncbi:hypothetical protein AB0L59_28415 [Streptomyces sp. NPDC052109]
MARRAGAHQAGLPGGNRYLVPGELLEGLLPEGVAVAEPSCSVDGV